MFAAFSQNLCAAPEDANVVPPCFLDLLRPKQTVAPWRAMSSRQNVECCGIQRDVYLSKTGAQLASTAQASGHTRGRPNGQVNNKHLVNEYIHRNQPTSQFSMESLPWPSINPSKLSGVTTITVIARPNMHAITKSRCMSFVLRHFRTVHILCGTKQVMPSKGGDTRSSFIVICTVWNDTDVNL